MAAIFTFLPLSIECLANRGDHVRFPNAILVIDQDSVFILALTQKEQVARMQRSEMRGKHLLPGFHFIPSGLLSCSTLTPPSPIEGEGVFQRPAKRPPSSNMTRVACASRILRD